MSCVDELNLFKVIANAGGIKIDDWELLSPNEEWSYLRSFSKLVGRICDISKADENITSNLSMKDLTSDELSLSLQVLWGIIYHDSIAEIIPGFVFHEADHGVDNRFCPIIARLPIAYNIQGIRFIVWIEGNFDFVHNREDYIIGVVPRSKSNHHIQLDSSIDCEPNSPEIWIVPEWPVFKLLPLIEKKTVSIVKKTPYSLEVLHNLESD